MVRQIIHLLMLEGVLLLFGWFLKYYETVAEGVFFFFIVLLVYIVVRILAFSEDFKDAKEINQVLAKRKNDKK